MPKSRGLGPLTDVAAAVRIDPQRLRALVIRGEIAGEKRDRHWYVDWADAERWKRARSSPAPAPAA